MGSGGEACVIMTTTNDPAEADRLAEGLVRGGLAACVQAAPITSHYMWEGQVERQAEQLLLIKTRADRFAEVEAYLRNNHSYEAPEILMVPATGGSEGYLSWLRENSRGPASAA
jgi:periplasmic divalent cation tolerance protein